MTTLLDLVGPAIWRASWQGAVLALVVVGLVRCCAERLSPRWRFLLWGVVLTRLLVIVTPESPWSVFNLARDDRAVETRIFERREHTPVDLSPLPSNSALVIVERESNLAPVTEPQHSTVSMQVPQRAAPALAEPETSVHENSPKPMRVDSALVVQLLTAVWLAGCVGMVVRLLGMASLLRRRLSVCQPVSDVSLMALLEECRQQMRLTRLPRLLVTPDSFGPCVVGTWNPKIVLPESVVTQSAPERLRHVLMHELAHLVRGDLWTNWLLLAVRVLHWFNPLAWWTVREMQAERESACDELVFTAFGDVDRDAYATTIVELAAGLAPSPLAPGLIGLFSSSFRLKTRVERLLRSPLATRLRTPVCVGLWLGLALLGLTDAMPAAKGDPPQPPAVAPTATIANPESKVAANPERTTLRGRCINSADGKPLFGVSVRLYRCEGRTAAPVEQARTTSRPDGSFSFEGLIPPRPWHHIDRLNYGCVGISEEGLVGRTVINSVVVGPTKDIPWMPEIQMSKESSTLTGQVRNDRGEPVPGAKVFPYLVDNRPVEDLGSATTDVNGRFKLEKLAVITWKDDKKDGKRLSTFCRVRHPDFPETIAEAVSLPMDIVASLPSGCVVTGNVIDSITGKPSSGAMVTASRFNKRRGAVESFVVTNPDGKFRFVLEEGRYDFRVDAPDRVCTAMTNRECRAREKVGLPEFRLISGGFISGQVTDKATGKPVSVSEHGERILIGLVGPSRPSGENKISIAEATVDTSGKFRMRAAPGANFPYILNARSERTIYNTSNLPAVVVKARETATCQLQTARPAPYDPVREAQATLDRSRKFIASLPENPVERTKQIILEVRKMSYGSSQTERWCPLIRELVTIGPAAVPLLCEELDHSNWKELQLRASGASADEIASARRFSENSSLRFYGFTLRAIGDPRAIPALIRAIPRTLLNAGSDCGMIVHDKELMEFMLAHDLEGNDRQWFGYGRPVREICGAIQMLTGQDFDHLELNWIQLSEDPRRVVLQRLAFQRQAQRCQEWWELNAPKLTNDTTYHKVNLHLTNEPLPGNEPLPIRKGARTRNHSSGLVVSPPDHAGQYISHFYDLDTMLNRVWPSHLSKDPASFDKKPFVYLMRQSGLDLMCVRHRAANGQETSVLRSLGMQVREITAAELGKLEEMLALGKLPEGRPVGDLLMHYDEKNQQLVPGANGIFLYVTREGNRGVIQTLSQIPSGVQISLQEIVP